MSDREIILIIAIAILLAIIIYQLTTIWRLHRSVDCFLRDLEEEQLLRKAENTLNRKLHQDELAKKDGRIALLEKALEGSERKRRELATLRWEDDNA